MEGENGVKGGESDLNPSSLYPRFSDKEFSRRYQAVRQVMGAADLRALIAYGQPGLDAEVLYLSHFPVSREGVLGPR